MCTVIDVPDDRTQGQKTYDAVMKFMDENPDFDVEPVDVNGVYLNKLLIEEELIAPEKTEMPYEDPKQDFGRAR